METSSYVAVSGQLALERRLASIAQNIANARTAGYRATQVKFDPVSSGTSALRTDFVSAGSDRVVMTGGAMTKTGNSLDVAVQGEGFLAMQSDRGVFYSRDGRLKLAEDGQLLSANGHSILDAGGAPIQLNPRAGAITISRDGGLYQNGQVQGRIGLYAIDLRSGFSRFENSGLVPAAAVEPLEPDSRNGLVQGFIEESNVNPVTEMVKLIQVSRAFESVSSMMEKSQDAMRNAIQVLGGR
jgi:flagellar basal-body rod protein FlgF